jgi:hypothetical protein
MTKLKNPNFKNTALYARSRKLVEGGTEEQIERWWITPLPYAPFNLRAPEDLLNDIDIRQLEKWLIENVAGGWTYDVNYLNQSINQAGLTNEVSNQLRDSQVIADGGSISYWRKEYGAPTNYKLHTFTSSGVLYMQVGGLVEYLIVGGGGGGGGGYNSSYPIKDGTRTDSSGGGGGGGAVVTGSIYIPSGTWEVTVGSGGSSGWDNTITAPFRDSRNGGNSSIFGITALGGGAGASGVISHQNYSGSPLSPAAAKIGASGGGGGYGWATGAAGTSGLGFAGGNANAYGLAGGGGGAGTPGITGGSLVPERAGDGGTGIISSITGSDVYYGGGGGGGCVNSYGIYGTSGMQGGTLGGLGGAGGGATARNYHQASNAPGGTNGLGGGGAGATAGYAGGSGGSGIVIIRYQQYLNDRSTEYWHYPYSAVAP